jgi:hypothetical protein
MIGLLHALGDFAPQSYYLDFRSAAFPLGQRECGQRECGRRHSHVRIASQEGVEILFENTPPRTRAHDIAEVYPGFPGVLAD